MKGPTTATGESAISIRVQAILGTAHRMQNPVSNAQSRQGKEMGRFYGVEFEIQSLSRQTGELDSTPFDREVKHCTLQGHATF
ncbi:MAG TPA: hypothetical protein VK598_01765 [Nitrospiraceae bacterium]|nr:hypothetical protein [Nitrospiraceae bacterium]